MRTNLKPFRNIRRNIKDKEYIYKNCRHCKKLLKLPIPYKRGIKEVKCPKCNRILGGKATKKRNGSVYYYYYCSECKFNIKETEIEREITEFMDDIVEYDSVVNQFFLPMIKSKFNNPKEDLEKELNEQKIKLERIKRAYINGTFTLEEYDLDFEKIRDDSCLYTDIQIYWYTCIQLSYEQSFIYYRNVKNVIFS